MANERARKLHTWLAIFFAAQIPLAVALYFYDKHAFNTVGVLYLVVVSQWALVASHWAAREADTD